MAQLAMRARMEATVMTYNNVFLTMSISFIVVMLTILFLERPKNLIEQPAH